MAAAAVDRLREALELQFPEAMPIARGLAPALATGVPVLDGALPNRGLPRGCLTLWRGGAASSALLRSACVEAVKRGERAVWVDGAGVTVGDFWPRGVMMVRPGRWGAAGPAAQREGRARARKVLDTSMNSVDSRRGALRSLSAAEELLRSGGFALVVVTGVPAGMEVELVRLSRVAREGGGAVVTVEQATGDGRQAAVSAARLRVETWYRPEAHVWRKGAFGEPVEVVSMGVGARVTGTGWLRNVNLELPVQEHAYRLSLDPGLVDRRGVRPGRDRRPLEREPRIGQDVGSIAGEEAVEPVVERGIGHGVQVVRDGVQSAGGAGLAGAGEAGGGAAGGGAAAADRGGRPDLGGRAWAGRASLRRPAVRTPG